MWRSDGNVDTHVCGHEVFESLAATNATYDPGVIETLMALHPLNAVAWVPTTAQQTPFCWQWNPERSRISFFFR